MLSLGTLRFFSTYPVIDPSGKYVNDQPHQMVALKIQERMPGSEPKPGDRVPYVFVDIGNLKAKSSDMAEDPKYAADHGLKIAYLYYLEHCLITPLATILEAFVTRGNAKTILFADIIRDHKVKMAGNQQITSFFQKKEPEPGAKKAKPSPFMSLGIQEVPNLEVLGSFRAVDEDEDDDEAVSPQRELLSLVCEREGHHQELNAVLFVEEERLASGPWTKEELLEFSDTELSDRSGAVDRYMANITQHMERVEDSAPA
jgi:hypothetical protein